MDVAKGRAPQPCRQGHPPWHQVGYELRLLAAVELVSVK
jgi:hypothetical protein